MSVDLEEWEFLQYKAIVPIRRREKFRRALREVLLGIERWNAKNYGKKWLIRPLEKKK